MAPQVLRIDEIRRRLDDLASLRLRGRLSVDDQAEWDALVRLEAQVLAASRS